MTQPARLTEAESAVLDATLPAGLKPDMRDVALCLFEVLVFDAGGGGSAKPSADWLLQLQPYWKLPGLWLSSSIVSCVHPHFLIVINSFVHNKKV